MATRLAVTLGTILAGTLLGTVWFFFHYLGVYLADPRIAPLLARGVGYASLIHLVISFALFLGGNVIYMLPSLVAISQGCKHFWVVYWLNLLLGWSCVLWVVAIVVALL